MPTVVAHTLPTYDKVDLACTGNGECAGSIRETLLYRGGVVSSSFVTDPSLSTITARRLARFSLLSEVGALAAT